MVLGLQNVKPLKAFLKIQTKWRKFQQSIIPVMSQDWRTGSAGKETQALTKPREGVWKRFNNALVCEGRLWIVAERGSELTKLKEGVIHIWSYWLFSSAPSSQCTPCCRVEPEWLAKAGALTHKPWDLQAVLSSLHKGMLLRDPSRESTVQ